MVTEVWEKEHLVDRLTGWEGKGRDSAQTFFRFPSLVVRQLSGPTAAP